MLCVFCFFFFFFQAEDGIRDHCVTGVQTCALPILTQYSKPGNTLGHGIGADIGVAWVSGPIEIGFGVNDIGATITWPDTRRSEERRVGKEWRSRWAAEQ